MMRERGHMLNNLYSIMKDEKALFQIALQKIMEKRQHLRKKTKLIHPTERLEKELVLQLL